MDTFIINNIEFIAPFIMLIILLAIWYGGAYLIFFLFPEFKNKEIKPMNKTALVICLFLVFTIPRMIEGLFLDDIKQILITIFG